MPCDSGAIAPADAFRHGSEAVKEPLHRVVMGFSWRCNPAAPPEFVWGYRSTAATPMVTLHGREAP
jgi:hypothetical protein